MDSQHIYWEVKRILSNEPDLRKELDELRYSLKELPEDFSREHFDMLYQEYEDFIGILINLVNLPKIKYQA